MYQNEDEYLESLKKNDSYHFSIPFTYIKKNHHDDTYDDGVTNMEVDVQWDSYEHGYKISYHVPEMYLIDPSEGNGDEQSFYEYDVEPKVLSLLSSMGITAEALVGGTGTF